jgi:2-polyprenyl-3-methyl-5-hydroxy-6-metoxy-1,4-benzoquinol methylase
MKDIKKYIMYLEEVLRGLKQMDSPPPKQIDYLTEFTELKKLLNSEAWPPAVQSESLCDVKSEAEKLQRASQIIDNLPVLANVSFLDFGCGEGHCVLAAAEKNPMIAVGYDINPGLWTPQNNVCFADKLESVIAKGPFDVILCNDVIDHVEDPVELLKLMKKLCCGTIHITLHPWTSRHATHLYHKINKAYIHLVFDQIELLKLGYKGENTIKMAKPLATYRQWFKDAQLTISDEILSHSPMEDFFAKNKLISDRIKRLLEVREFPQADCSLEFVDYVVC